MKKFLPVLFILIIIALVFKFKPEQQPTTTLTLPQATQPPTVATPSATPKPNPIPAQSGRSVRIPILTYHFIGNNPNPEDKARDNLSVSPEKFEEQMSYLSKNGYNTTNFDTLIAVLRGQATLPPKPVILTFDDGYIDFYINAFPILRRYNLQAVSFLPTGLIGTSYYMSWDQVKEINASGLVSFQAHSATHANLSSLSDDKLMYQLQESKRMLESQLGKPVNTLAYPYGISDERVWQAAKSAGFIGAVGTWYGNTSSEGTLIDLPRIKISGSLDLGGFISKL